MGSDAEIFVFDHKTYIEKVVPDFQRFLLTAHAEPWLSALITNRHIDIELNQQYHLDLVRFCTYLSTSDLSWKAIYEGSSVHWDWEKRACSSPDCPERANCPYHSDNLNDNAGELNRLFEVAVAAECLGESQFIGRSADITLYDGLLQQSGIGIDDPLCQLLLLLARRGFIIGYQWINSDGIHGWLDHEETEELFQRLDVLNLPQYETSFGVMESFNSKQGYQHPEFAWDALSLSFIRTVACIAIKAGKGILWGNSLMSLDDYT